LALVASVAIVVAVTSRGDPHEVDDGRCANDAACGPGRICAAGGCLPLLASEHRGIWRDDLNAQLDAGVKWSPKRRSGVRLLPSTRCPAKRGKVETPPLDKMREVSRIDVFEVGREEILRHLQVSAEGSVWIDAMRLRFPPMKILDMDRICASDAVVAIAAGKDADGPFVDVSLKNAAPAGNTATAAVALRLAPPTPDPAGVSTLTFELAPGPEGSGEHHTVLAVPLGADVDAIEGAAPSRQQLLTGFAAYCFEPPKKRREVRVRYRTDRAREGALDITEVAP